MPWNLASSQINAFEKSVIDKITVVFPKCFWFCTDVHFRWLQSQDWLSVFALKLIPTWLWSQVSMISHTHTQTKYLSQIIQHKHAHTYRIDESKYCMSLLGAFFPASRSCIVRGCSLLSQAYTNRGLDIAVAYATEAQALFCSHKRG